MALKSKARKEHALMFWHRLFKPREVSGAVNLHLKDSAENIGRERMSD